MSQDLQTIRQNAAKQVEALRQMMATLGLEDRIEVWHELVEHAPAGLQQIQQAAETLGRLPKSTAIFAGSAITVASALSSMGNLDLAEKLLVDARASATKNEQALIAYNLFQLRVRKGAYDDAMEILNAALRADRAAYSLHDTKKYPPLRMIGAGSMGCVFQCENAGGGKPVAVKTIWEPTPGAGNQIFAGLEAARKLQNEAILAPVDYGYLDPATGSKPYVVLPRVPGAMTGEQWLEKQGPLSLNEAKQVGKRLLEILATAHAAGLCHLNLHPGNIMVKRAGPSLDVVVTDFGMHSSGISLRSRVAATASRQGNSVFGQKLAWGLQFAAPEVRGASGFAPGVQADLYSFACTMYRFMTGDSPAEMNAGKMSENPELYRIFTTCRWDEPGKRPGSAAEVAEWWEEPQRLVELQAAQREAAKEAEMVALGGVRKEPVEAAAAKSKLPLIIGIVAGALVLGGVGLYFGMSKGKKTEAVKEDTKPKAKPAVSEAEMERLEKWYKAARDVVSGYLHPRCQPYYESGYKFYSYLIPLETKEKRRRKMRTYRSFKLDVKPDPNGKSAGALDTFECPGKLAQIHHDHTYKITMRISFYRANMFSRGSRSAVLEVESKLLGYLSKKSYRSGVAFRAGFALPGLRRAEDPGLQLFRRSNRGKLSKDNQTLEVANLVFKRTAGKGGLEGRWETSLRSVKYKKELDDWASGCTSALTEELGKTLEAQRAHKLHRKLRAGTIDWVAGFCGSLTKLSQAIEPWNAGAVGTAVGGLMAARKNWNENIYKPLVTAAQTLEVKIKTPGF